MKRTNLIFAASLLVFATFMASCQKSETTNPMVEISQDDDQVGELYDDMLKEVDETTLEATPNNSSAQYAMEAGSGTKIVTITFSGDTTIKTITFTNFVNNNNESGHIKNGVIVVKILGGPRADVFKRIILLQNFTVDGILIEGKKEIVKTGQYVYSVTLTGGKTTFTDGTNYTREFTRVRTWAEGYNTATVWDDVFTIEGVATGTNRKGNAYTHTITSPLVVKNSCRWIVEGVIELKVGDKVAVLDYGMGECDNDATITINGEIRDIKLRGRR